MTTPLSSVASRAGARWLAPLALLVTGGIYLLSPAMEVTPGLLAAASAQPDTDADGLHDAYEISLFSSRTDADTDGDGFSDTEELARGTSLIFAHSIPTTDRMSLGMTARGESGRVVTLIAMYLPDGDLARAHVDLGMVVGPRLVKLPQEALLTSATLEFAPAREPRAVIALLEVRLDTAWVLSQGQLTLFATLTPRGAGRVTSAAKVRYVRMSRLVALAAPNPYVLPAIAIPVGGGQSTDPGTIYVPLAGDDIPSTWTPGEVCVQNVQNVAVSGAIVTQEVVSADCMSGWQGYCPPDCQASVGSTHTTVDPVILIGG